MHKRGSGGARRRAAAWLGSAAVCAALAGAAPAPAARDDPSWARAAAVADELLVGFRADVGEQGRNAALARAGVKLKRSFSQIHGVLGEAPHGHRADALETLRVDPRVRYAEPNGVVTLLNHGDHPNDPGFHDLWGLDNFGQVVNGVAGTPDADIDALQAWSAPGPGVDVTVGVIDTGVDFSHPDLGGGNGAAPMWTNTGESCAGCRNNGVDDDGNGYLDDWRGWDFLNGDNDANDDQGHGTHVAGTIGALADNGIGVAGVAPHVRLMALKFIGPDGTGTTSDAISALLYATAQGVVATNNSWGNDEYSQALADAIASADAAGDLFVAAAGNNLANNDATPNYPSSYPNPNVVAVAATDQADNRAWFSSYGARTVDLGAPGMNIISLTPGGGYRVADGTSMATPHVTGAIALVKSLHPTATALGLKALLLDSVDSRPSLAGMVRSGGRLNADTAARCTGSPEALIEAPGPGFDADVGSPVGVSAIATDCGAPAGVTVTASVDGATLALTPRGDGLFTGSFTPSATGTVTLTVTASAAGRTASQSVTGIVTRTYPISPGGPAVTVSTSSPGENAALAFDGIAGRRVALGIGGVSIGSSSCCSAKVSIAKPDGGMLVGPAYFGTNGGFVDVQTLPVTGRYKIVVDPQSTSIGSATLVLYDVPADAAAAVGPGGPAAGVTVVTPGQNARVTFTGTAGRRASVRLTGVTMGSSSCCGVKASLVAPNGSVLFAPAYVGTNGGFLDTRALPLTGTYTVFVDPQGPSTGSATVTVYDVPADAGGALTPGGGSVGVSMSTPGQNARPTFSGIAGRRVSLSLWGVSIGFSSCCSAKVSILKPDGSTLVSATSFGTNGGFLDAVALPVTGTYSVFVDPQADATGGASLTLFDVPPDASGTLVPGGGSLTVSMSIPGQNARPTFSGVAGRRVSLSVWGVSIGFSSCCSAKVSILKPDGSALAAAAYFGRNGGFVDVRSLPVSGTYAVVVDPQADATGGASLTLYDVPPDATGSMTVGGAALTATLATPGQNARLTFAGTAGTRVTLALSGVSIGSSTCCSAKVSVLRPDGTALVSPTYFGRSGKTLAFDVGVIGTYTVVLDPEGAATGVASARVS